MAGETIKTIVIVGGGTAGWMTAAALAKSLTGGQRIVLVESDEIGTIGVGEATVPSIAIFNAILGFDVPDFMRACQATFKLGIEFVDWGALGRRYMHPFTQFGADVKSKAFTSLWMDHARRHPGSAIDDYNLGCIAAAQGRFVLPFKGQAPQIGPLSFAFHFDATLYAGYLRTYAEGRGVQRIEGKVAGVVRDSHSGDITELKLESGETVAGDLFVDCSGFQGLLIAKSLQCGYDDWSHWLPCDRAIAVPSENLAPPAPFTRSTADGAGWRWRIPLQHRTGNGHVYAAAFMSDDEAEQRLLAGLDGLALAAPRRLRFVTGKRRKVWDHNCIAIGLASGFLEPLESTSIYMIQTGILRLLGLFFHSGFERGTRDAFNQLATEEFENIRDFIVLHYKMSTRDDTPFWRHCRDMAVPDRVAENMALFARTGQVVIPPDHPFPDQGWMAVMLGQGGLPASSPAPPGPADPGRLDAYVHNTREALNRTVAAMPSQEAFLKVFLRERAIQTGG